MAHLSIEKLRSPRSPRRSSGSFFYPESGNNSGSSTPFVSAPSSPRSSPRCYYYYSAPPSPPRGRETEAAASVPFSWEEKPGTPKKSDSVAGGHANSGKEDNGTMNNSVDHLTAMGFHFSAPVSPQRDFNFMDGNLQQQRVNSSNPLDEFEFSSARMSDAESVASSTMLHADELFFQGQILPLKLPPRLQHHKSNLSLSLQLQDFSPRAQDSLSFSPRSAAGSSFVHQLHSPKSPKSPQPPASLFSPKSPTGYRNPKSPRAKSPSRLPKVGSSDENKHPSRMQPQPPRPSSSIASVRKSLRELLHLNSSNSTSSGGSIMKKDGSVKSSGTDSSKSSRSSSSSSQRYSSSRSSSVSSNKSGGSARNSFSSSRQVNPLPRELLQNLQAGSTRLSELHFRGFFPGKSGPLEPR